jgi:hypothetical protein
VVNAMLPVLAPNTSFNSTINLTHAINWATNLTNFSGFMLPVKLTFDMTGDVGYLVFILMTMFVSYMKVKRLEVVAAVLILLGSTLIGHLSTIGKLVLFWLMVMVVAGVLFKLYMRRD